MDHEDLDALLPVPGDLIVARRLMRAWESESRRGQDGPYIEPGEQALVVATWEVGQQRRLKVVRGDRILVFSCAEWTLRRNWKVVAPAPRFPAFDCS